MVLSVSWMHFCAFSQIEQWHSARVRKQTEKHKKEQMNESCLQLFVYESTSGFSAP